MARKTTSRGSFGKCLEPLRLVYNNSDASVRNLIECFLTLDTTSGLASIINQPLITRRFHCNHADRASSIFYYYRFTSSCVEFPVCSCVGLVTNWWKDEDVPIWLIEKSGPISQINTQFNLSLQSSSIFTTRSIRSGLAGLSIYLSAHNVSQFT